MNQWFFNENNKFPYFCINLGFILNEKRLKLKNFRNHNKGNDEQQTHYDKGYFDRTHFHTGYLYGTVRKNSE